MSENIPESIPTSISHRSHRPLKKARATDTATATQSQHLTALFANPARADLAIPAGPKPKPTAVPPEIVANVQGSSAGAGSGEFHVYKASRRREYERQRVMEEEMKREEAEREFLRRREEREREERERLERNRVKREKARRRKGRKLAGGKEGGGEGEGEGEGDGDGEKNGEKNGGDGLKRKLVPAKVAMGIEVMDGEMGGEEGAGATEGESGIVIHDDD